MPAERIGVVIHPQSVIHSMVEYVDGSVIAQLGIADMSIPISYILAYPERLPLSHLPPLDLPHTATLTFSEPDLDKFPCLGLAYRALRAGGTAPAVLNAANEVAVATFLAGSMGFLDIPRVLSATLDAHQTSTPRDLADLLKADLWAREQADSLLSSSCGRVAMG
jgi:1-deoxy-D-xylulose-5-phosphate reductoisomerase